MDSNLIDELFENWNKTKQEISNLEKKLEKYKNYTNRILKDGKTSIDGSKFVL